MDENILRKFSNTPSQNNGGLTREPCNNLENLHESSPPLCQDFSTPMLSRNASVNRLEKETAMKIAQNKKKIWSINGNKKTRLKSWLNSNIVITESGKNKDDTAIHGNINNKEAIESINNNDTGRVKTKAWRKGTCLVTAGSVLEYTDETQMFRKFKVKFRPFPRAKTEDIFHYLVPLPEKMPDYVILHVGTLHDAMDCHCHCQENTRGKTIH